MITWWRNKWSGRFNYWRRRPVWLWWFHSWETAGGWLQFQSWIVHCTLHMIGQLSWVQFRRRYCQWHRSGFHWGRCLVDRWCRGLTRCTRCQYRWFWDCFWWQSCRGCSNVWNSRVWLSLVCSRWGSSGSRLTVSSIGAGWCTTRCWCPLWHIAPWCWTTRVARCLQCSGKVWVWSDCSPCPLNSGTQKLTRECSAPCMSCRKYAGKSTRWCSGR